LIDKDEKAIRHSIKPINIHFENPLKGLKKLNLNELPTSVIEFRLFFFLIFHHLFKLNEKIFAKRKTKNELFQYFLNDYSNSESLHAFETIKNNSECVFSKRAHLWGSDLWNENLTVEENIHRYFILFLFLKRLFHNYLNYRMIPSFIMFCNVCTNLKLDGYLIQVSGKKYGTNLEV